MINDVVSMTEMVHAARKFQGSTLPLERDGLYTRKSVSEIEIKRGNKMAYTAKFLNPIRLSLSSMKTLPSSTCLYFCYCYGHSPVSHSKQLFYGSLQPVKIWMKSRLQPAIRMICTKLQCKLYTHAQYIRNSYSSSNSGSRLSIRSMLGVSFMIGSISLFRHVACAMDGLDVLVDDQDFLGASDAEEDSHALWVFVRKLWLPAFLLMTVLINWGQPLVLATKVILLLLSTKPSPLSVYVFVEQLCHQSMCQEPHLYFLKSLYAKKVEVQDYRLLCLAKVEIRDEKFILVGILGGWWALPLSGGAFSACLSSAIYT